MKYAALFLLAVVCSAFAADSSTQSELLAIDSAFVEGDYSQVELLALRLLQNGSELTAQELSRVSLTAGYALIMLNREADARDYFRRALKAQPDLTLDPVQVSPKFRMVFDEVKASYQSGQPPDESREKIRPAPAKSALLSNLLIPGSGQWRDGRRLRGAAYFAVQAATVGMLVWQIGETRDARDDYLAETDPRRIAEAYDTYDRNHRLAWGSGVLAALVYLAAQSDLVLFRPGRSAVDLEAIATDHPTLKMTVRW